MVDLPEAVGGRLQGTGRVSGMSLLATATHHCQQLATLDVALRRMAGEGERSSVWLTPV